MRPDLGFFGQLKGVLWLSNIDEDKVHPNDSILWWCGTSNRLLVQERFGLGFTYYPRDAIYRLERRLLQQAYFSKLPNLGICT